MDLEGVSERSPSVAARQCEAACWRLEACVQGLGFLGFLGFKGLGFGGFRVVAFSFLSRIECLGIIRGFGLRVAGFNSIGVVGSANLGSLFRGPNMRILLPSYQPLIS